MPFGYYLYIKAGTGFSGGGGGGGID